MRWKEIIAEWQGNSPIKQLVDIATETDAEMDPNNISDPSLDEKDESMQIKKSSMTSKNI